MNPVRSLPACLAALLLAAAAPWAQAQAADPAPLPAPAASGAKAEPPAQPAFSIEVRAPEPLRTLLDRDLDLRRYRAVTDLDEAELARLTTLAERNARELVATLGYFNPHIAIRRETPAGGKPVIVVEVEPGPITHVESVDIGFEGPITQAAEGDIAEQREGVRTDWRLPPGHEFTQDSWAQAKTHALRQLVAHRYPAARISYSIADVDAQAGTARLGLRLDSGRPFRLGTMQVSGMQRYDPVLVPRLARLPPGSTYDQEALVQAQLRLTGSGYFDSAFLFVDPESDADAAPVQATVREAPLHKVVFGLGLSTDSGVRGSVEYRNNRLPVIGWQLSTKLQLERKQPYAQVEANAIPDDDGWRWGVSLRAERTDDGTLVTQDQRLRVGRSWLGDHIERNVYLQYDRASVQPAPGVSLAAIPDNGDGTALSANYIWTGRYFDSLPYPSRGHSLAAELGGGVTLTGSRSPFQRTVLRWVGIRPLAAGRLQFRAEGGAVLAAGSARVPSTQLFRTGGDSTVRGYGFREIGVDRGNGVIAPGRYEAVGSVEWQQPIKRNGLVTNWESAVFLDAGSVSDRIAALRPRYGAGAGVRWKSPLGPVQADLAWGFTPRKLRLHLTFGTTF
ncbi:MULTISPECIES: BamA/TamA family outer membrane protein [Ramlibacter]|uniref:BamA/TamA family outer membrane protein n=1 Tax=Ramlibacter aquaticus TaxID=2780094 RepID=A0ABR9SG66_9BURK|nr:MULTISPECIES: BamA/TamA family outer membrane protein [Ramlibacter]MBE7941346.1 BamA/TamA family outer membrane protein [Ramlibacter aquaticus]